MNPVRTCSREETAALGASFARSLWPGAVVGLTGEMGSGKTQFVLGVCEGLGVRVPVTSPTFTLINEYPAPFGVVAHMDLYRIGTRAELAELGVEEYFHDRCICLIEWAERMADLLPPGSRRVTITWSGRGEEREFMFDGGTP